VARFKLLSPIAGSPVGGVYRKFATNTVVVDSVGNALSPSDVVWPALCAAPTSGAMYPLDASAIALMPAGWSSITLFGAGVDAGA
jgi:hypothetical protein